jgi:hypothetical protein
MASSSLLIRDENESTRMQYDFGRRRGFTRSIPSAAAEGSNGKPGRQAVLELIAAGTYPKLDANLLRREAFMLRDLAPEELHI